MTELGKWIDKHLESSGRDLGDLAKAMGIDPGTLGEIIRGEIKRPPDARLSAMARFFGVSAETIRSLISGERLDEGADIKTGDSQPGTASASAVAGSPGLRTVRLFGIAEVAAGEHGKRQDVLLVPDGRTTLRDGTNILVDRQGFESVAAAFEAGAVDIPFDINHSTVIKAPRGEESPAFGWGKALSYRPGRGIFCDVEWTDDGHDKIRAAQYRYLSPVISFESETGRVRRVHSAALTTMPATPGMPALAATHVPFLEEEINLMDGLVKRMLQEGDGVVATAEQKVGELKALLETMGIELGDGADFVAIINAAIGKLKGDGGQDKPADGATDTPPADAAVAASVRIKLGLGAAADKATVLKALSDLQGHVGYVPAAEHGKLVTRVDELEADRAERNAADLVNACLAQGKLLETDAKQMEWASDRAKNDPQGFKTLMAHAPVIVPQGRTMPPTAPGPGVSSSGNEDKLIEKSLSDHQGVYKDAMIALQTRLMSEQTARGLTNKAARAACERQYPKIFGAAA